MIEYAGVLGRCLSNDDLVKLSTQYDLVSSPSLIIPSKYIQECVHTAYNRYLILMIVNDPDIIDEGSFEMKVIIDGKLIKLLDSVDVVKDFSNNYLLEALNYLSFKETNPKIPIPTHKYKSLVYRKRVVCGQKEFTYPDALSLGGLNYFMPEKSDIHSVVDMVNNNYNNFCVRKSLCDGLNGTWVKDKYITSMKMETTGFISVKFIPASDDPNRTAEVSMGLLSEISPNIDEMYHRSDKMY